MTTTTRNNRLSPLLLLGLGLVLLAQLLGGAQAFVALRVPASQLAVPARKAHAPAAAAFSANKPFFPLKTATALRAAGDDGESATEEAGPLGVAAAGLGLVACPVVFWSEYTLKTTGCGLPAGPGGALGALEGVSYLVVAGVFLWSIVTKVRTGKGLPAGPAGLLGAVEGMSFLAVVAGLVIAGLTYVDYGSIPEAVPVDGGRCSNI